MKYLFSLLLLSVLVTSLSKAQSNYKPGYVVNKQNDTLKGFIDYREWEVSPKEFNFKSALSEKQVRKFSIDDANAFSITGAESFRMFTVAKSTGQTNSYKLSLGIDTSRTTDTAFLKLITGGKNVSLYSLTDNIKTRYYVTSTEDRQPVELDYYIFYIAENNVTAQTLFTFRTQLKLIASHYDTGSARLTEDLKYAKYREHDLRNIVDLINGDSKTNTQKDDGASIRFFAGAAARFSQLQTGGGSAFFPDGTNANNTSPAITIGFDNFLNRHTQKVIFRTEIALNSSHYIIPPTVINGFGTTASFDLKQFTASLIPQIIYSVYSVDKFKVFIDAGLSLNYTANNKYYYLQNFNNVSTIKKDGFPELTKFQAALPLKAGFVIFNKVEIYASHAFRAPITQVIGAGASVSYTQAGINYFFGVK